MWEMFSEKTLGTDDRWMVDHAGRYSRGTQPQPFRLYMPTSNTKFPQGLGINKPKFRPNAT